MAGKKPGRLTMNLDTNLVLITGPLGWLGTRVVEALVRGLSGHPQLSAPAPGLRLRCLVQPGQSFLPLAQLSDRLRICVGDLRRPADLVRFCDGAKGAVLLHTAGVVWPLWTQDYFKVNRDGTAALLDAAMKAGVRRVVAVSHAAACGGSVSPEAPLTEDSPCRPRDALGRSMLAFEKAVAARQGELETVILRAPQFYGPNPPSVEARRFRRLLAGGTIFAGPGGNPRSMVFVDNVCQAVLLAAGRRRAAGQLYWIADRATPSVGEIESTLDKLLRGEFGKPPLRRKALAGGVFSAASALTAVLQGAGLAVPSLAQFTGMTTALACSIAKAEAELSYQPAVELEEGLRQTLRWCVEHPEVKPVAADAKPPAA
jgi:nucleoside-diphosphate-sugar epimerase